MLDMADQQTEDDMRLLSFAYVEALLNEDSVATKYLERDGRHMARCVGALAWFLMDAVVIPAENGVAWQESWITVDFRRRTDPEFRANLFRRGRYRRLAHGITLRPKWRLRRAARDSVDMLCAAYLMEYGRERSATKRDAALEMVGFFRKRLCHSSDAGRNA